MKKFLATMFLSAMVGCMYQPPMLISQPPGPSATTIQATEPVVVSSLEGNTAAMPPRIEVYRPDPTKGMVTNMSKNLFVKVWLNSRSPAPPTLELEPEVSVPVIAPLGIVLIYAEARIKTPTYGWAPVGACSREIEIKNISYSSGGFAWRIYFNDGDFAK